MMRFGEERWALFMLFVMMALSYVDRSVLGILAQPIKETMHLTDFELGCLGGPAFAILFILSGIPIARLAERYGRVSIIAVCMVLWSSMTALCGSAASFLQLFLCRVGVGIGEAGSGPPAQSLVADFYPSDRRAAAVSIYLLGIPLGNILGTTAGGAIGQSFGWRIAFFAIGLPGVLLAILFRLTLREPVTGRLDARQTPNESVPPIGAVLRKLARTRTFLHMAAGASIANFTAQGFGLFLSAYFLRRFNVGLAEVGLASGLIGGMSAAAGTLGSGYIGGWAARSDLRWLAWTPAIGLATSVPLYLLVLYQNTWSMTLLLLWLPGLFFTTFTAPMSAITQNVVPARMRATTFAILFTLTSFVGVALGPFVTGLLGDLFTSHALHASGGALASACRMGSASHAMPAALKSACRASTASGLRNALTVAALFALWASFHFWRAARTLTVDHEKAFDLT
jgi:MFS family permease